VILFGLLSEHLAFSLWSLVVSSLRVLNESRPKEFRSNFITPSLEHMGHNHNHPEDETAVEAHAKRSRR
jgi:hypothetical protein